jgi:hypothetical protein
MVQSLNPVDPNGYTRRCFDVASAGISASKEGNNCTIFFSNSQATTASFGASQGAPFI